MDERAGQAVDARSPNWPVRCPQCCYIFDGYIHTLSGGTREDIASEGFQGARRPYLTEEYTVVWPWFQWICEQLDCQPDIDAFASLQNRRCQSFFDRHQDALIQEWSGKIWLNPPWSFWEQAAKEVLSSQCTAICIIPAWKTQWAQDLLNHAEAKLHIARGTKLF